MAKQQPLEDSTVPIAIATHPGHQSLSRDLFIDKLLAFCNPHHQVEQVASLPVGGLLIDRFFIDCNPCVLDE